MDDMEDHHDHPYANMSDLRQLINGGAARTPPRFPAAAELFVAAGGGHRSLPFEMMMGGRTADLMPPRMPLHDFVTTDHDSHNGAPTCSIAGAASASGSGTISAPTNIGGGGLEGDLGGGDGGTGRWPRQETLTLLDIRSRLDPKFKEANHKGPLWDEVSRIMSEEHGYLRSGKKCREKFENLYKYYKKTKEGKAGRQDGKHYRFFRQLEALYGETSNMNPAVSVSEAHLLSSSLRSFHGMDQPYQQDLASFKPNLKLCDSLSLSNSSEFDTSSSGEGNDESVDKRRKRRGGRSWKAKIKDFIDAQMRKLMERQEAWLEKMMRTMEQKEQERVLRDEQWRKEEAARIDREQKLWAKEKAWIETRDAALMEILEKIKGREGLKGSSPEDQIVAENENGSENLDHSWSEPEITRLMQLRSSLESSSRMHKTHTNGDREELLWEEIGAKMSCYGYERSASMCKEKWEAINYYFIKRTKEEYNNNKKRKENSRTSSSYNFHNYDGTNSLYNQGQGGAYSEIINEQGTPEAARLLQPNNNDGSSPSSSNAGNVVQDSCFRFLMGDGDHQHGLWESYGLNKLNKGENH